jgi:putative ABC transport system ATP-binding protein
MTLAADALRLSFSDSGAGSIQALDDVSARFSAGELTVIVGPSGSGKSSLLHALAGIVLPQGGQISFGTTVVNALPEPRRDAWRLKHCGMVFQDFRLIDELDALGNVLLPAQFQSARLRDGLLARAQQLLEQLMVPWRRGSVGRLSRGEQQRVALARALLLDPSLILADEPTASLDAENGQRIAMALKALAKDGKVVAVVSHDDKVVALADRVVTLKAGRIQPGSVISG